MKILVYDVAAQTGGAAAVLEEFYQLCLKDKNNEYLFLLSQYHLKDAKNIQILNYYWIKKSWLHRLYFDYFIAYKIVESNNIDHVLSLQNTIIPRINIPQTIYEHNVIPFSKVKFSLFKSPLLWIYQNIIGHIIKNSLKKSTNIIVQTYWMKNKIIHDLNIDMNKIRVLHPKINKDMVNGQYHKNSDICTFFYPASGQIFKNHQIIIDACIDLKKRDINNYKIVFSLIGNENKHIRRIKKICLENNLPIEWVGWLSKKEVIEYYQRAILLFPSYLETVGLPLLEASLFQTPMIVADFEYSHEFLQNCSYVHYFNAFDAIELEKKIVYFINSNV